MPYFMLQMLPRCAPGVAFLAVLLHASAFAQERIPLDTTGPLELEEPGVVDEPVDGDQPDQPPRTWDIRLGLLAIASTEYEGSGTYELNGVPYARISYKKRITLTPRSLAAVIYRGHGFRAGPILRTRGGRNEDDDDILRGLGDVDRAFEAGGFLSYARGPVSMRIRGLTDISKAHRGTLIEFGGALEVPFGQPWFKLRASTTWADRDFTESFFGIDAAQAARSGLAQNEVDAGFKDVRVSVGSRVRVVGNFYALATVGYKRLIGDAADSPIVKDHGDADEIFGAMGAMYRF